jgi:hypothetical protein
LKSDDVSDILDELMEAQNHSYVLGLKLLPTYKVEAIHRQYQDPKERLLHILLAFTRQIQPRPTWRVIVEALRSPSVNLPAPAVDKTLKSDDVSDILDELMEAQNHSYVLGLKLLPTYKVEAIHRQYQDPRVIVEALRSPSVNLPGLAARVEAAHFPDSTATRDVVPNESAANTTTAAGDGHEIRTELSSQPATGPKPYCTPKEVKDDIDVLECEFNSLKKRAIELLEASKLGVEHVVYELTTLSSSEIDQYKVFLEEKLEKLRQIKNN